MPPKQDPAHKAGTPHAQDSKAWSKKPNNLPPPKPSPAQPPTDPFVPKTFDFKTQPRPPAFPTGSLLGSSSPQPRSPLPPSYVQHFCGSLIVNIRFTDAEGALGPIFHVHEGILTEKSAYFESHFRNEKVSLFNFGNTVRLREDQGHNLNAIKVIMAWLYEGDRVLEMDRIAHYMQALVSTSNELYAERLAHVYVQADKFIMPKLQDSIVEIFRQTEKPIFPPSVEALRFIRSKLSTGSSLERAQIRALSDTKNDWYSRHRSGDTWFRKLWMLLKTDHELAQKLLWENARPVWETTDVAMPS